MNTEDDSVPENKSETQRHPGGGAMEFFRREPGIWLSGASVPGEDHGEPLPPIREWGLKFEYKTIDQLSPKPESDS